jgi:hypothetical protein
MNIDKSKVGAGTILKYETMFGNWRTIEVDEVFTENGVDGFNGKQVHENPDGSFETYGNPVWGWFDQIITIIKY